MVEHWAAQRAGHSLARQIDSFYENIDDTDALASNGEKGLTFQARDTIVVTGL